MSWWQLVYYKHHKSGYFIPLLLLSYIGIWTFRVKTSLSLIYIGGCKNRFPKKRLTTAVGRGYKDMTARDKGSRMLYVDRKYSKLHSIGHVSNLLWTPKITTCVVPDPLATLPFLILIWMFRPNVICIYL